MCTYSRMIYSPLDIYPVMGLLGQVEFLFLGPWGIATLSSTMVELIYTPTSSVEVFLFLHILSSICCPQIFNDHHSNWHEMVSQCGFDLHLSDDLWRWAFFHMFVGLMYVFFCKVSVHILRPLLNGLVCFFLVNLFSFFVNSGYQPFVRWVNCKNFFPFCWLPIHSSDCFFCRAEAVEFD